VYLSRRVEDARRGKVMSRSVTINKLKPIFTESGKINVKIWTAQWEISGEKSI
jgi:hypothetical protein